MQMLVTVAVFGLVPMPDMVNNRFDDHRITSKTFDVSQLVLLPGPFSERMATKEELARIRYELERLAALQGK